MAIEKARRPGSPSVVRRNSESNPAPTVPKPGGSVRRTDEMSTGRGAALRLQRLQVLGGAPMPAPVNFRGGPIDVRQDPGASPFVPPNFDPTDITGCDEDPATDLPSCSDRAEDLFDNPATDAGDEVIEFLEDADDEAAELLDDVNEFLSGGGDGNVATAPARPPFDWYAHRQDREARARAAGAVLVTTDWRNVEATFTRDEIDPRTNTLRHLTLEFPLEDGSTVQFNVDFNYNPFTEEYEADLGSSFRRVSSDGTFMELPWPNAVFPVSNGSNATSGFVQPGTNEALYSRTGDMMERVVLNEILEQYGITEGNVRIGHDSYGHIVLPIQPNGQVDTTVPSWR